MNEVLIEVNVHGDWKTVGSVSEVEPPGSISDETGGRQVYMFGWYEGVVGVWRSHLGIDAETPAFREITTTGFDRLADLAEPYELTRVVRGEQQRLRFRLKSRP